MPCVFGSAYSPHPYHPPKSEQARHAVCFALYLGPCGTPISSHFVCGPYIGYMKELLRTNDITLIAFTKHVLSEVDIAVFELDVNMSVLEGSIGILPQRLMVIDEEYEIAYDTMIENGIEAQFLT